MLPRKRLVEECEIVYIYAVQQEFRKKTLLKLIHENRPLVLSLRGGPAEIWLTYDTHQLPGERDASSLEAGTVRLWFSCPRCQRTVAKLYYYLLPGSPLLRSDVLCRHCHRLAYQVDNCGDNRWYRVAAAPLKRLLRCRERLLRRKPTAKVLSWLKMVDNRIRTYQALLTPKRSKYRHILPPGRRERRPYRDGSHLLDPLPTYFPSGHVERRVRSSEQQTGPSLDGFESDEPPRSGAR